MMKAVWSIAVFVLRILALRAEICMSRRYRNITDEEALEKAREILSNYPLVDGHNDLPFKYRQRVDNKVYDIDLDQDVNSQWGPSHTDIPRLREGQVGGQDFWAGVETKVTLELPLYYNNINDTQYLLAEVLFWSAYSPCSKYTKDAVRAGLEVIDTIKRFTNRYPDDFEFVTTADGIEEAFSRGRIASMIGVEGGHAFDSSLAALRMAYQLGARYFGLTHSCTLPWVDTASEENNEEPTHGGLTEWGQLMIWESNRLGMIVDLAHVSADVMRDVLDITEAPIIFSHSNVRGICDNNRNVPDDVLLRVGENGGMVMVTFVRGYLGCYPSNSSTIDIPLVADHIEYIRDAIGVDHVGIGSDFDGISTTPSGLENVSKFPYLIAELVKRSWEDLDLEKVAGRNLVRVFREVEQVRDRLSAEQMLPLEEWIPTGDIPESDECRTTG